MVRNVRNQTHRDFRLRVKRVDPVFYRWGERGALRDATIERPVGSALAGFFWSYVVVSVARNRDHLEDSLAQGSLDVEIQTWILNGLAALLAVSVVMLLVHAYRFLFLQGGKRKNSGGMLMGLMGTLVLVYTPASVWQTGYGMLDDRTRTFVTAAAETTSPRLKGFDDGIAFVSSIGK